jgi:DnaJ-class molecular chaperone
MAADPPTDAAAERATCSPCRGTGTVTSGLGGTPTEIPCPWCEGTGRFIADHDAQARFRPEGDGGDGASAGPGVD